MTAKIAPPGAGVKPDTARELSFPEWSARVNTEIASPRLCGHILGMLVQRLGADHVLWGIDSIWWGSPRWQIEALRRFTMPETLMARLGYGPLTPDVKARIFGLNAARLFGAAPPTARRDPRPA